MAVGSGTLPPTGLTTPLDSQPHLNQEIESARSADSGEEVKLDNEVLDTPETAAELDAALETIVIDTPGSDSQKPEDAE